MLRDDAFFLSSKGLEIALVVGAHLALSGGMALAQRLGVKQ